jgi:hypothetical protein
LLTKVHINNCQPHSALKDLTDSESFDGWKPSIQHLEPFKRECYIHFPYQKWKDGKTLFLRAQSTIFTGYTNTINHYIVFLPNMKKTILSADIFWPPLEAEGTSPLIHCRIIQYLIPLKFQNSPINYTYSNKAKSRDDVLRQWLKENPQEANNIADNRYSSINPIMWADSKVGKWDKFLQPPCWVYDDNNMPYSKALTVQTIEDAIGNFNGSMWTAIPDDHFFREEHQNPNQRYQIPMVTDGFPPPRSMMPPPILFTHVVTRAGSIVDSPESYGFENQGPELTMLDVSPGPPTPDNQPLEGHDGCQWANLSVLEIDKPKSYWQAKVSAE